VTVISL